MVTERVECTWRPLLNAVDRIAKNNEVKTRGVPQTRQPVSAVSGQQFSILREHV